MGQDTMKALVKEKKILYYKQGEVTNTEQEVIEEIPLTVFFNGEEFITLLCSPVDVKALVIGFLRTEGLLREREDLLSVDWDKEKGIIYVEVGGDGDWDRLLQRKRTLTSGCGKGTTLYRASDLLQLERVEDERRIRPQWILSFLKELNRRSNLYRRTRGMHSSALSYKDEILFYAEDIGRHNAVDKLIGKIILDPRPLKIDSLISSGRISSEILLKAARVKIPVVISRAAPTSLSVELAEELGLTIVAFVQGENFKVFSHPERIL